MKYATQEVRTVGEDATLQDVIRLMASGPIRHVPVLGPSGQLTGIISDRDVRRMLPSPGGDPRGVDLFVQRTRARDVMTRQPIYLLPGASLLEAVNTMLDHGVGALPIVEHQKVVGILSRTDLLRAFAESLQAGPPDPAFTTNIYIEETAPAYEAAEDLDRSLIFVVEPSPPLRRDLVATLSRGGLDVTAFEGMVALGEHGEKETPDLILVSAELGSAESLLEHLRTRHPLTPVVMTREGSPKRGEPRHNKGPLFLPCSQMDLLSRIRGEIGFSRWTHDLHTLPGWAQTGTLDIDVTVPRQVLVVDPDPLTRQVLSLQLRRAGCEVREVANGREAMACLATETFDVVTLDLDLPFRNGFELLAQLRKMERAPRVVVISGVKRDEDVVEAFALGALDVIKKPVAADVLESRLRRALD